MRIYKIYSKLRKKNIKNYFLLFFSIAFSMAFITSYSLIFCSPTIHNVLVAGGDSMRLATMIFILAILGCAIFVAYASTLFLRYKSREIGILLSLGTSRMQLKKILFIELIFIILTASLIGAISGIPLAYISWNILVSLVIKTAETKLILGFNGYIFSVLFFILVIFSVFITARSFIKKTNIIDIINTHRMSEKIKDVSKAYGILGFILIPTGLILGYILSATNIIVSNTYLHSLFNMVYLLSFIGTYMALVYITVRGRKGKNLKKYYKGIISYSMIRFHGRQNVKTMCVATLIAAGGLFGLFNSVNSYFGGLYVTRNFPSDYLFNSKLSEVQVTNNEIYELAQKYDVNITRFNELFAIELIRDGYREEYLDNGNLKKTYCKQLGSVLFIKESDYNKVTKENIHIQQGQYCYIEDGYDTFNDKTEEKLLVTNPETEETTTLCYDKSLKYVGLSFDMYRQPLFVISDEDYEREYKKLKDENKLRYVRFDVADCSKSYDFAENLRKQIVTNSSSKVAIHKNKPKKRIILDPDSQEVYRWWMYNPKFRPLEYEAIVKAYAVYMLLFIFIAFICFAGVETILYVRSMTMALHDKFVYNDLLKLGANQKYIKNCITKQLKSMYALPILIGSAAPFIIFLMSAILEKAFNPKTIIITMTILTFLVCLYQYCMFILVRNKVLKLIKA